MRNTDFLTKGDGLFAIAATMNTRVSGSFGVYRYSRRTNRNRIERSGGFFRGGGGSDSIYENVKIVVRKKKESRRETFPGRRFSRGRHGRARDKNTE